MIIETWVAVLLLVVLFLLCCICAFGWLIADQMLEESRKEKERMQGETHYLRGKLIVKTATNFYNEGKKK